MYMTIRKGVFDILIRYIVFLDIEGWHNNMLSNLKKIDICPVKFFTRRRNNIVETHFCDRESIFYQNIFPVFVIGTPKFQDWVAISIKS